MKVGTHCFWRIAGDGRHPLQHSLFQEKTEIRSGCAMIIWLKLASPAVIRLLAGYQTGFCPGCTRSTDLRVLDSQSDGHDRLALMINSGKRFQYFLRLSLEPSVVNAFETEETRKCRSFYHHIYFRRWSKMVPNTATIKKDPQYVALCPYLYCCSLISLNVDDTVTWCYLELSIISWQYCYAT